MGMFDFLKGVGESILGGDNDDKEVENLLNKQLGGKIQNLKAEVSDGLVKLHGTCDSLATKEKAVLLAGNIKGIEKVDDTDLKTRPSQPKTAQQGKAESKPKEEKEEGESQFYEIKSGDNLSKIAKQFYGDANKYPLIFEANREVIKDPDKIYPGQKIRIPKSKQS
ncbi:MAG TPA: peptidoglycan-binding protein LysM [Thermodesulfobacteriota bacterium]|nr:peptidoglycan-binding protein LysM [Thermodesulfobacteriota bacterium]